MSFFKSLGPINCYCERMSCDYNKCATDSAYGNAIITVYDCITGSWCDSTTRKCAC